MLKSSNTGASLSRDRFLFFPFSPLFLPYANPSVVMPHDERLSEIGMLRGQAVHSRSHLRAFPVCERPDNTLPIEPDVRGGLLPLFDRDLNIIFKKQREWVPE